MSDLLAKCDWLNGDVLVLTLPQDPSSIRVKLFDSKHAPSKAYVPESYPKQWELGADYLRLGKENEKMRELLTDLAVCACGKYCYGCPHQYDGCDRDERLRELGMEVES